MPMTQRQQAAALSNLFPDAAAAVAEWPLGLLEARAAVERSSQALCVSVWETIGARLPGRREELLSAVFEAAGLTFGPVPEASVRTEVRDHQAVLNEVGAGVPTSLDGLVEWKTGVVSIESKFTEREFGSCFQPKPSLVNPSDARFKADQPRLRLPNCTGDHAVGSDLKPATARHAAACRLTVQDGRRSPRRYWDIAPELFQPSVLTTGQACPFCTDAYQLMRNLAFACQRATDLGKPTFGCLVMLVDAAPAADRMRAHVQSFRNLLRDDRTELVGVMSYEQLASVLRQHHETALAAWVEARIAAVCTS